MDDKMCFDMQRHTVCVFMSVNYLTEQGDTMGHAIRWLGVDRGTEMEGALFIYGSEL